MTGGVAALMGAMALGPRIGKYDANGKPRAIPGHSIPFAVLGVFILWLGWFGFNPGSELAADGTVITVALNTMLAAVAGGMACTATIWWKSGKPDLAMIGNGVLAGLVAITAPCGTVNAGMSIVIGAVAGVIVVFAVFFFDRIHIDDPVGAISVHGVCGAWGLLSVGLFAQFPDAFVEAKAGDEYTASGLFYGGGFNQLAIQAIMLVTIVVWVAVTSGIVFFALKKTIGLRVTAEEEIEGLDVLEHGLSGYAEDLAHV
jgi:Amt family ammonium transporter